jgi:RNA polymerase primary sigma factor
MAPPRRKKAASPSPRRPARGKADKARAARAPKPRAEGEATGGGDSLQAYIREISRFKPLSADDEKVLGRRIQAAEDGDPLSQKDGQEALQKLVESNLRFVVSYAKRYRGLGLSFLDLIHEGTLGLIEAAKRFDPDRNVKFISYAVWWIRQSIFHALSEQTRAFRLPPKLSGMISKVVLARQQLAAQLQRPPTAAELAAKTELSEAQVTDLLQVAGEDLSLSSAVGEDGSLELGDTLEQDTIPSVELEMIRTSTEQQIRAMVAELDDKEREVIQMRFGLDGEEPRTLQEIGDALGVSRERIRQIESRAKEKLRRSQRAQGMRGELN